MGDLFRCLWKQKKVADMSDIQLYVTITYYWTLLILFSKTVIVVLNGEKPQSTTLTYIIDIILMSIFLLYFSNIFKNTC